MKGWSQFITERGTRDSLVVNCRCLSHLRERSDNKCWASEAVPWVRTTSLAKTRTKEFSLRTLNFSKSCPKQQAPSICAPMTKVSRPIKSTSRLLQKRLWFNRLSELQVRTTVRLPRSLESFPKPLCTRSFQMFQRINNYHQLCQRMPIHLDHSESRSLSQDNFPRQRFERLLNWGLAIESIWCLRHNQKLLDRTLMLSPSSNQRLYSKWNAS